MAHLRGKVSINNLKQALKNNKWLLCLLLVYIVLYTFNLDKYPKVWADEAVFINPAFNLAFNGFFGTTMMPTFYNISQFTYWQMPLYMVLLTASFKLFGFGIIQARIVSVILGFFTVLFTYLLAKELYNKKIGLIAVMLLIFNPLFFLIARQVRMDIAVACFTLIALYFLVKALKRGNYSYYFGSGFFAMLSVLSHPDGLFGVICIALVYSMYRIDFKNFKFNFKLKEILYWTLGPILLVIPYLYYISLDFPAFVDQFKNNVLSSASGPLSNILSESTRYIIAFTYFNAGGLDFTFIILVIIMGYLFFLGLIYIIQNWNKFSGKFLILILSVHLLLFAVLISQKTDLWYFAIVFPYLSIIIALSFNFKLNIKRSVKHVIISLLCTIILINAFGIIDHLYTTNNRNYQVFTDQVGQYVPEGSVIMGDTAYWMTLHNNYTYYSNYKFNESDFKKLKIEYILYDTYWSLYLNSTNSTYIPEFLSENCTLIGVTPDSDSVVHSPIKIYKINY